ncbi:MAG: 3-hydroxypropionyl-coenzyme A synthetase [Candidatus Heimdallarchaeota archaeon LC_2]|nr:MAG: 3-hydroxypropionyl-coenzyme A synthetase [Candidatus Heimdallarchaeota archaeon LC_2]
MSKLIWKPSELVIKNANITKLISYINEERSLILENYADLYEYSIESIADFWEDLWKYNEIIASKPYTSVVENIQDFPPNTKWFLGSKLNFAENLLRYKDDHTALLFKSEDKQPIKISYKDLNNEVAKLSYSLSKLKINPGDRIVGYMPNLIETVVAMLATTSLGATWASCGAELGSDAAIDRLGQITPRVLFTVDAYPYKGKKFDQLQKIKKLVEKIPSIEHVVVLPYQDPNVDISNVPKSIIYHDFISKDPIKNINFKQLPFDHPLYIMFSSGTTGKPKCMVQGAGGVLINHLKELVIQTDLKRSDSLFYITSPSWMMWNWLISGLAVGATIVLYDGNPLYPNWNSLWKFIGKEKITIFGCSASYLHYLKSINAKPSNETNLNYLREISQTGSALSPEGFEFVYKDIKEDLHLNSISGGTDINGCFAGGSPNLPVYVGELQGLALGMKVKSYDENANSIFDTQGELVCEAPSPSMPIYFWNDKDNAKYKSAYFDYYDDKKVWRHGDYIQISSETGGVTFFGRSDATLKPSGVRIGTAEIYNVVEVFDEISDSLAIGQNIDSDQRVVLFIQLNEGYNFDEHLQIKIKANLRSQASPRHVPSVIMQVQDIPYTFSGKKVESAVTNILHERKVTNRGALRNPESLDEFEKLGIKLRKMQ